MSRTEHFEGNLWPDLHNLFEDRVVHVYTASTSNLSCVTALFYCLLCQFVDLANQEWLLSSPDVCLVMLPLQQPIVTKTHVFLW